MLELNKIVSAAPSEEVTERRVAETKADEAVLQIVSLSKMKENLRTLSNASEAEALEEPMGGGVVEPKLTNQRSIEPLAVVESENASSTQADGLAENGKSDSMRDEKLKNRKTFTEPLMVAVVLTALIVVVRKYINLKKGKNGNKN